MTEFKASLDKIAIVMTVLITLFFVFLIVSQVLTISNEGPKTGPNVIIALVLFIYTGAYLFRPLKYTVTESGLIIHRPISNVKIRKRQIKHIQVYASRNMYFAVRTFGVGGLFGYFGRFYTSDNGVMTWYVTRQDRCVLIVTDRGQKIVVSPN
ncbi:MAG TPA: PH domain-containing protein, partial [Flavobacterium sp.]